MIPEKHKQQEKNEGFMTCARTIKAKLMNYRSWCLQCLKTQSSNPINSQ